MMMPTIHAASQTQTQKLYMLAPSGVMGSGKPMSSKFDNALGGSASQPARPKPLRASSPATPSFLARPRFFAVSTCVCLPVHTNEKAVNTLQSSPPADSQHGASRAEYSYQVRIDYPRPGPNPPRSACSASPINCCGRRPHRSVYPLVTGHVFSAGHRSQSGNVPVVTLFARNINRKLHPYWGRAKGWLTAPPERLTARPRATRTRANSSRAGCGFYCG